MLMVAGRKGYVDSYTAACEYCFGVSLVFVVANKRIPMLVDGRIAGNLVFVCVFVSPCE